MVETEAPGSVKSIKRASSGLTTESPSLHSEDQFFKSNLSFGVKDRPGKSLDLVPFGPVPSLKVILALTFFVLTGGLRGLIFLAAAKEEDTLFPLMVLGSSRLFALPSIMGGVIGRILMVGSGSGGKVVVASEMLGGRISFAIQIFV